MDRIHTNLEGGVLTRTFTDEATGKMIVRKEQDISGAVEYATRLRNAEQYSSEGIKKNWMHVAEIPAVVIVELKQINIDVYTASAKEIVAGLKLLHKEHLLTTTKQV
jgi:hypothetical protein